MMAGIHSVEEFLSTLKVGDTFWFIDDKPNGTPPVMGPLIIDSFQELDFQPAVFFRVQTKQGGEYVSMGFVKNLVSVEQGVFLSKEEAWTVLEARKRGQFNMSAPVLASHARAKEWPEPIFSLPTLDFEEDMERLYTAVDAIHSLEEFLRVLGEGGRFWFMVSQFDEPIGTRGPLMIKAFHRGEDGATMVKVETALGASEEYRIGYITDDFHGVLLTEEDAESYFLKRSHMFWMDPVLALTSREKRINNNLERGRDHQKRYREYTPISTAE